jgi:hypothetical protein
MTHRRLTAAIILALTIPLGLLWRNLPLHLSPFLWKYGGSVLWAIALYWFLAILLPRLTPFPLAILATAIAAAVEFSRLWHTGPTDAFRLTLAGKILLGRFFSFKNILAYTLAITLTAALDAWRPNQRPAASPSNH